MTHTASSAPRSPRARDLGLDLPGTPGPFNAITDVPGVEVGFRTVIEDAPRPGRRRPVRSGVTAILPRPREADPSPVYAGIHRFNGNGEMTGSHWIEDGGFFVGPVLITNTHAVGACHQAAIRWMLESHPETYNAGDHLWLMPVVAETYDGVLNDINGLPLTEADARAALDAARPGPVAEGNVGGGTGMIAYRFKAGTGTASRKVTFDGTEFTVGVLVQANHGIREWFSPLGVPVGRHMPMADSEGPEDHERGSIIIIIATDLPLAPHQLKRLARRGALGIARGGTAGGNSSGDIFLAFSTANARPLPHKAPARYALEMVNDDLLDPVYQAAVEGVEEAVLNSMIAACDLGGTEHDIALVKAINHDALVEVMRRYGRVKD
ncbi:MAG: P1 family peptidase [Pannonibacter sp.]